jgi:soluble lytic murein transglycosylase-like protein
MTVMPVTAATPESVPSHMTTVVRADVKTGRLIRSTAISPRAVSAYTGEAPATTAPTTSSGAILGTLIDRIASEQGVEAPLVRSVIQAESNYNPSAVSPKGALGMMQLIPSTARRFGVADAFNVADNIQGGVRYLRFLLDYYNNDYVRAIAAYNAGEAAVDKYNGIPPYSETRNYVYTVARNLKTARARQEETRVSPLPSKENTGTVIAFTGSDGKTYYRTP